jgi:hypothetical protein
MSTAFNLADVKVHPLPERGFVICSSSSRGSFRVRTLFMVDRRLDTRAFWRDNLDNVLVVDTKEEADHIAGKLKYNHPHVVSLDFAKAVYKEQTRRYPRTPQQLSLGLPTPRKEYVVDGVRPRKGTL